LGWTQTTPSFRATNFRYGPRGLRHWILAWLDYGHHKATRSSCPARKTVEAFSRKKAQKETGKTSKNKEI